MSVKTVFKILFVIAVIIAILEGVPQKGWLWFTYSEVGEFFYSLAGGQEHLSGLLRGPLDSTNASYLSASGIIKWTNTQREGQGLGPLHENLSLRKAAEAKLEDMFAQQYFEHKSPDGKTPADVIKSTGYAYVVVGENLALGNFIDDQALVQAWMDSPGHRANILHAKFEEIGTATRKGMFEGKEVWLAVQEFGAPLSSCPSADTSLKIRIDANRVQLTKNQEELQRQKTALNTDKYQDQEAHDQAVEKYNTLVKQTNALSDATQELVSEYNDSVNKFNRCLESNA